LAFLGERSGFLFGRCSSIFKKHGELPTLVGRGRSCHRCRGRRTFLSEGHWAQLRETGFTVIEDFVTRTKLMHRVYASATDSTELDSGSDSDSGGDEDCDYNGAIPFLPWRQPEPADARGGCVLRRCSTEAV
jgi:hypothetical protein